MLLRTDDVIAEPEIPLSPQRDDATPGRRSKMFELLAKARRHGLSAFGPLSISAAHFLAAIMLLHHLPSAEFGEFSFLIIVSSLGLSITNGLIGAPLATLTPPFSPDQREELDTYVKTALLLSFALSFGVASALMASGSEGLSSVLFGIYAGLMSLRLCARTNAYAGRSIARVVVSDCVYSLIVLGGLIGLIVAQGLSLTTTACVMMTGAALAIIPFGRPLLESVLSGVRRGSVRSYGRVWMDLTRWSLLGVVTTEATINAHAYLVTFLCGAGAFAPIAVGALFMRPFNLIAAALPDQERPAITRTLRADDIKGAIRIAREFLVAISAIWIGNIALAATVIVWYPQLVVKKGIALHDVVAVFVLFAVITAVRGIRAADAMFLTAAREFKPLADASTKSSIVALILALGLLLAGGAVASLGGILVGDIVMWVIIAEGARRWRGAHSPARLGFNAA